MLLLHPENLQTLQSGPLMTAETFSQTTDCQWTSSSIKGSWSQEVEHCIHNHHRRTPVPHPPPPQPLESDEEECRALKKIRDGPGERQTKSPSGWEHESEFWTAALLLAMHVHPSEPGGVASRRFS